MESNFLIMRTSYQAGQVPGKNLVLLIIYLLFTISFIAGWLQKTERLWPLYVAGLGIAVLIYRIARGDD